MGRDILQEIPDNDLPLLRDMYKNHKPKIPYVASMVNTCMSWRKKKPEYLNICGIDNDWLETGTFVAIMHYPIRYIFFNTLQEDESALYQALIQTKRINWKSRNLLFAILGRFLPLINDIFQEFEIPAHDKSCETGIWEISKEEALNYDIRCPDDVYIAKLDLSHAKVVNHHWPFKLQGSDTYVSTLIEMNNCYGIFLKSDDSLVSWILTSNLGQLANLQTVPEYYGKGYGSLLTKYLAKEVAESGYDAVGTVVTGNNPSEKMFQRLGFQCVGIAEYHFANCNM